MLMCGGSAKDLPSQTPQLARHFNVVDTFDTHARVKEHFESVDEASRKGGKLAIISVGWDPGIFSLFRLMSEAFLPDGDTYTFWGRGLSQGHSDALRHISGVDDARQFTVPNAEVLRAVESGERPRATGYDMHRRECYIVLKTGADREKVTHDAVTMKNYFEGYKTDVNFVSAEELLRKHSSTSHGGKVIRNGSTGDGGVSSGELCLRLRSNAEFTASVAVAFARAAYNMNREGTVGCKTVFDIAPRYLINDVDVFKYL